MWNSDFSSIIIIILYNRNGWLGVKHEVTIIIIIILSSATGKKSLVCVSLCVSDYQIIIILPGWTGKRFTLVIIIIILPGGTGKRLTLVIVISSTQ